MHEDIDYMHHALKLAALGSGRTRPNPLVGAVLVKDGKVVGEGYHEKFGGPHAEINALRSAGKEAEGATMYVTMEPCVHHGKTPPCTEALVAAKVGRVVCAIEDPNPLVAGKGIVYLESHGIPTTVGLLREEASRLNEIFTHHITLNRPYVILKSAMSLDGKIATSTGESRWISSEESRAHAHALRNRVSAIVVGVNTVLADDPMLTTRLALGEGVNPLRIVMDSEGRTPLDCKLFATIDEAPLTIVTTERAPQGKVDAYRTAGATVVVLDTPDSISMVRGMLSHISAQGIDSLLVEGGGTLAESFVKARAVDKYVVYIAPMVIGGKDAPTAIEGEGVLDLTDALRFPRVSTSMLGPDILIEAYSDTSGEED